MSSQRHPPTRLPLLGFRVCGVGHRDHFSYLAVLLFSSWFGSWHSLSFRSRKVKGQGLVGKSPLTWPSSFLPPGTASSLLNLSFSGQALIDPDSVLNTSPGSWHHGFLSGALSLAQHLFLTEACPHPHKQGSVAVAVSALRICSGVWETTRGG